MASETLPKQRRDRVTTLENRLGIPFTEGNRIDLLTNGKEIFPAMLDAIESAGARIDFLTFVYWTGQIAETFAEALCGAAARGVRTRIVLDSFGANSMDPNLVRRLERAGCEVSWFRPLRWHRLGRALNRTHRKLLIVDGRVGFTGGVGIAEEWDGDAEDPSHWRDNHFRLQGPVVRGLNAAFLENWIEATSAPLTSEMELGPQVTEGLPTPGSARIQTIRSSPSHGRSSAQLATESLLELAQHHIRLGTPYFTPSSRLWDALLRALERGVQVSILLPGEHTDKRISKIASWDFLPDLLDRGAQVSRFAPTMYHVKSLLIDDSLAAVGSANFNSRSAQVDDEVLLVVEDSDFLRTLTDSFRSDLDRSRAIEAKDVRRRNRLSRLFGWLTRPLQSQL